MPCLDFLQFSTANILLLNLVALQKKSSTLLNDIRIQNLLGGNREEILAYGKHYDG